MKLNDWRRCAKQQESKHFISNKDPTSQITFTCSKLITKTLEKVVKHVFIVNFEHISYLFSSVSIVDFKQVNVSWVHVIIRNISQVNNICSGQ